jgi:hypothetical protein
MCTRVIAIGSVAVLLSGCGLVYQGRTQTVRLSTQPEGATISFDAGPDAPQASRDTVSPATLTLSRRVRGDAVFRATKEGYQPACRIIDCGTPGWIKIWNSLSLGFPWLIDLAAGTLGNCDDAEIALEPVRAGAVPFELPRDDQIPRDEVAGACLFPYLYDPVFAAKAERIIVSTGPLQQPYELLGNVDFGKLGFDRTTGGAGALRGFAFAWARRTFSKAPPAEINALLRKRALYQYGNRVDALINVNYQTDPANNVFATAVAVHFSDGAPQPGSASARLSELEKLHQNGLIDRDEYERKRAEILRGL